MAFMGIVTLVLLFITSVGSTIFWVLGCSTIVVLAHAYFYDAERATPTDLASQFKVEVDV